MLSKPLRTSALVLSRRLKALTPTHRASGWALCPHTWIVSRPFPTSSPLTASAPRRDGHLQSARNFPVTDRVIFVSKTRCRILRNRCTGVTLGQYLVVSTLSVGRFFALYYFKGWHGRAVPFAARLMLDEHGATAARECGYRAAYSQMQRDPVCDGHWRRVAMAVGELRRKGRK